jgi:prepilin-type N-terminal cleavage/methylation domain-containing protein
LKRAFTLIELLVVIAVMIILMAAMLPAIKSMTRNNNQKQAVNQITIMLAQARSVAISQRRQTGVVFFEETAANASPYTPSQTAAQIFIEDPDQTTTKYPTPRDPDNTFFIQYAAKTYLPVGVMVATLNDATAKQITTGGSASGSCRAIMFDSNGQLVLRNGLARANLAGAPGVAPRVYGDWNFNSKGTSASSAASSPGLVIFGKKDYEAQGFTSTAASQTAAATWVQQHSDVIVVNAYTGQVIR